MFHALRYAMLAEDGTDVLPLLNTWFRAVGPFTTSSVSSDYVLATGYDRAPSAEYGGSSKLMSTIVSYDMGIWSTRYYLKIDTTGTVDVVVDDRLLAVSFSDPTDYSSVAVPDMASRLLEVMAIGSRVTLLADYAFMDCRGLGPVFDPVYLGTGLSLGNGCFEGCRNIQRFSEAFLSKVLSSGEGAFAGCSSLSTIEGMSAFNPSADRSFYKCRSLASLDGGFSSSLDGLGDECFFGCASLADLDGIPPSLAELGTRCFAKCSSLSDISALGSTALVALPDECFRDCVSLGSLGLGQGSLVEEFGKSCFEGCSSLSSLVGAPPRLERLWDRCFAETAVTSLYGLPGSVADLGDECFLGCVFLESLDHLPSSISCFDGIGTGCFRDCYADSSPESEETGLSDISGLASLVPTDEQVGTVVIPSECFMGDELIRSLPDYTGLMTDQDQLVVGSYAFSGCSGLDSLAGLPTSFVFREGAFSNCFRAPYTRWAPDGSEPPEYVDELVWRGLCSADMSMATDLVTSLPDKCFQGCGALASLPPLPPKLASMGESCFADCSGMKSLASLADLDIHEYPSFGAECFARCGTVEGPYPDATFLNDPDNVPQIGQLTSLSGLDALLERIELEKLAAMAAPNRNQVTGLLEFVREAMYDRLIARSTANAAGSYISESLLLQYFSRDSGMFRAMTLDAVYHSGFDGPPTLAGLVPRLSRLADRAVRDFAYVYMAEILEGRVRGGDTILNVADVHGGKRHDIVAFLYPGSDEHKVELWFLCPGLPVDALAETSFFVIDRRAVIAQVGQDDPYLAVGTFRKSNNFTIEFFVEGDPYGTISEILVTVRRDNQLVASADISPMFVVNDAGVAGLEPGPDVSAPDVALVFSQLFSVAAVAVSMGWPTWSGSDWAAFPEFASFPDTFVGYVLDTLDALGGPAVLSELYDLEFVPSAGEALGPGCFRGCSSLGVENYPMVLTQVPEYCFEGTACRSLWAFSHVGYLGSGAFAHSRIASMSGFPSRVTELGMSAFRGCSDIEDIRPMHRNVDVFSTYSLAENPELADVKCGPGDPVVRSVPWRNYDDDVSNGLIGELIRAAGWRYSEDRMSGGNYLYAHYPPLAAFTEARAVHNFGAACFKGDTSLTDDSFTVTFTAGSSEAAVGRVESAVSDVDVKFGLCWPVDSDHPSPCYNIVFHLADSCNLVVEVQVDSDTGGPLIDKGEEEPAVQCCSFKAAKMRNFSGSYDREIAVIEAQVELNGDSVGGLTDYSADVSYPHVIGMYPGETYISSFLPAEASYNPLMVLPTAPARVVDVVPPDFDFPVTEAVSISRDGGELVLTLDTEGRRFLANLAFSVNHTLADGASLTDVPLRIQSSTLKIERCVVQDTGDAYPGYPSAGESVTLSAVPLLKSIGASCFEGCTGLGSLDWIPFGVKSLPDRCFAGVPFTHSIEDARPARPGFGGWACPTLDAYKKAVDAVIREVGRDVRVRYGEENDAEIVIQTGQDDEDYVRLTVTQGVSDGSPYPILSLDAEHRSAAAIDCNQSVRTDSSGGSLGRLVDSTTYGFSGPVDVLAVQGDAATLKVGELTMRLMVTDAGEVGDMDVRCSVEYVSCPPYEAMGTAVNRLGASLYQDIVFDVSSGLWQYRMAGAPAAPAITLRFSWNDGSWTSSCGPFPVGQVAFSPVNVQLLDDGAVKEKLDAAGEYWFKAFTPEDGTGFQHPFFVYAIVAADPVPVARNSVVVPYWIDSIGADCFTFDGFEDAEEKIQAVYISKSPGDIRAMENFPWGIPSGCRICATIGGAVYTAP